MSIKRRIHTLKATLRQSQEPYQDENGNTVFPDDVITNIERSCRAESNTIDGQKPVVDGFKMEYNYLIFTDIGMPELPLNTRITITVVKTGKTFGVGDVVKFETGQRVSRIWLK